MPFSPLLYYQAFVFSQSTISVIIGSMTSPIWDKNETRQLAHKLYGKDKFIKVSDSVRSVDDRTRYARYHYDEAFRLYDECAVACDLNNRNPLVELARREDDKFSATYGDYLMKVGAHVTAFVQSVHAVPDICAYMIYCALGFDTEPDAIPPTKLYAATLLKRMGREPDLQPLRELLAKMQSGKAFEHLDAAANNSKHRSIVRPAVSHDMTGKAPEKHWLTLESFSRAPGKDFPSTPMREFMIEIHDHVQPLSVDIGLELTKLLRQRVAARASTRSEVDR